MGYHSLESCNRQLKVYASIVFHSHFCQLIPLLPPGSFRLIPFICSALLGGAHHSPSPSYPGFVLQQAALQRAQGHSAYTVRQRCSGALRVLELPGECGLCHMSMKVSPTIPASTTDMWGVAFHMHPPSLVLNSFTWIRD